jgi:hypothetical protein
LGALLLVLRFGGKPQALEVARVESSGSPSASRPQARSTLVPLDVNGNAPWALSALPDCFEEMLSARGTLPYVKAHLPAGGRAVAGSARLRSANCLLSIAPGRASVQRGTERLIVPPVTQFYAWPDRIGFVRHDARGAELRVYRLRDGSPVVLAPEGRSGP